MMANDDEGTNKGIMVKWQRSIWEKENKNRVKDEVKIKNMQIKKMEIKKMEKKIERKDMEIKE